MTPHGLPWGDSDYTYGLLITIVLNSLFWGLLTFVVLMVVRKIGVNVKKRIIILIILIGVCSCELFGQYPERDKVERMT